MGQGYLLDTNTCLYFLNQTLSANGFKVIGSAIDQAEVALSVVTQMELLGFAFPSSDEENITEQFVADMPILTLSDPIVRATIAIRKKHKIKLPDAIIAATALVNGLTMLTRNTADFTAIDGLLIINPLDL